MYRRKLGLCAAALAMMILILDSKAAVGAAQEGVSLCIRTVIPSLFPFFLLSGYLTGGLDGGKFLAALFRCPESSGTVLLTGLLGGYPVGARSAAEEFRSGSLPRDQANRLLMFCSQAGPSFLFGIVAGQFDSPDYAWRLWAVQLLSALSVAWLLPKQSPVDNHRREPSPVRWNDLMTASLRAMASVCGWVIAFGVVLEFLRRWVLWLLPEALQILLCGLLELTNGCLMLSRVVEPQLRFLLAALMLNFGGLCVLMQTSSVTEGLEMRHYLLGKAIQTAFSLLYALTWMGKIVVLIPVFFAFIIRTRIFSANRGGNPVKIGV